MIYKINFIKKLFVFNIFIVFFVACTKDVQNIENRDKNIYIKGVEDTIIKQIVYESESIGLINATFLNNSHPNQFDNNYNNFLIGLYVPQGIEVDLSNTNLFTLTLDNEKFSSFKVVKKSDMIYNQIPIFNPYAQYYIVSFKKELYKSQLNLYYKFSIYNRVTLAFVVN